MVHCTNEEKLVKKLLGEDAAFRKDYKTHKDCELKLEKLAKKIHLTPADSVEVVRLKKLKLALKDGMTRKIDESSN